MPTQAKPRGAPPRRQDIPAEEFMYRRGYVDGIRAALGIIGRADRSGVALTQCMGAGNMYADYAEDWRDTAPARTKPPKAPFYYSGPPLWQGPPTEREQRG